MNYDSDIRIDETALDVEWLEQPVLMLKYTRHAADMRREADRAKETLESVKAKIDSDVRKSPGDFDLGKVTDASVASAILNVQEYKVAYQSYLDAKYEADMASGAVRAFEQRKDALENLARLYAQQYFAGPKMPRDITWERQEKQKDANDIVATAGKMTRRRSVI